VWRLGVYIYDTYSSEGKWVFSVKSFSRLYFSTRCRKTRARNLLCFLLHSCKKSYYVLQLNFDTKKLICNFFPKFVSTQEEKNTVKSKFSCQNSNVENSYLFYDMRHPLCFDEFAIFFFVFGIGTLIFHSACVFIEHRICWFCYRKFEEVVVHNRQCCVSLSPCMAQGVFQTR